jgi:hypothetical protein
LPGKLSVNTTHTRRSFLQSAAAALAGPLIMSSASGEEKKAPPSERLTLGFIGVGTQNRGHLSHFLGQKDVQVVAVCDVDTTRRDNAKDTAEKHYGDATKKGTYKGCAAYNDFRDVLKC